MNGSYYWCYHQHYYCGYYLALCITVYPPQQLLTKWVLPSDKCGFYSLVPSCHLLGLQGPEAGLGSTTSCLPNHIFHSLSPYKGWL